MTSSQERNLRYVVDIEVFLAKVFNSTSNDDEEDILFVIRSRLDFLYHSCRVNRALESIVPLHFYGVMAKTDLGCQVLQEKGHFAEFAHFIRQHGRESEDQDLILKLKSILWAVVTVQFCHLVVAEVTFIAV